MGAFSEILDRVPETRNLEALNRSQKLLVGKEQGDNGNLVPLILGS